jgi:nicotinate phosphoribosyltransferase
MNNPHLYRLGYFADAYFNKTKQILQKQGMNSKIIYQIFPRKDCVLCGSFKVQELLRECAGYYQDMKLAKAQAEVLRKVNPYTSTERDLDRLREVVNALDANWVSKADELHVYAAPDGTELKADEPAMGIEGNPIYFAHLESPLLGILSQESAVATVVRRLRRAVPAKKGLFFFPARFRAPENQRTDGYAAYVGGCKEMSTDANCDRLASGEGMGTMPHLLIGCYGGNTAAAAMAYDDVMPEDEPRIVLVDWDNDCILTTLQTAICFLGRHERVRGTQQGFPMENYHPHGVPKNFNRCVSILQDSRGLVSEVIGVGKGKLAAVRFDTSGSLIDKCIQREYPTLQDFGVCSELVFRARKWFDSVGLKGLKIIVSGGFTEEKIVQFERLGVPYDAVGVGSSIFNHRVDFTADIVGIREKDDQGIWMDVPCAKVGREKESWDHLDRATLHRDWFQLVEGLVGVSEDKKMGE